MQICPINACKSEYMPLLLLGDEQQSMVARYLARGEMFVLKDPDVKTVAVVTQESDTLCELKNLATWPCFQRQGYGKKMVEFLCSHYKGQFAYMQVGTGESDATIPFYKSCGFVYSHRIPDFFTDNYDHPIFEGGVQLKDMVYLKKKL